MLLIQNVYAQAGQVSQAATTPEAGSSLQGFIPILLIFVVFYFFLIRPQQKKMKEHKSLIDNLKKGEKVITAGGIVGTISRINDHYIWLEVAKDNVIQVVRSQILSIYTEQPVNDNAPAKTNKNKPAEKKN
jgi:preprotein translocase subunit YajC